MCWSGEASAALALGGFATSAYFYRKGEPKELWGALAYFSAMEAIQAYTYSVIDQCSDRRNQTATLVGYLHIAFQPFFANAVALHFVPEALRKRIQTFVYGLCLVATSLYLLRLYPFSWTEPCYDVLMSLGSGLAFIDKYWFTVPFCGRLTCSTSGQWHIAWSIPARYHYFLDNAYPWAAFYLPMIYGSWRVTLYLIVCGPFIAYLTTNNSNEWAAVWCLYSIALISMVIKSPLRKYLYVKSWYGLKVEPPAPPREN